MGLAAASLTRKKRDARLWNFAPDSGFRYCTGLRLFNAPLSNHNRRSDYGSDR